MRIETLHQLYLWARNQIKDGWFNAKILNSKDISDPIVKAIEKQVKIDVPEIKIPDFKEISSGLKDLINKKEKDVIIKKITINNRELLDVLERIESKTPQEQLDFTPILNEIYNLIDGKSSDFSVFLNNFPIEDDRVKVSLSEEQLKKIGGKGTGSRFMSSENVKDSNGERINPAIKEKQNEFNIPDFDSKVIDETDENNIIITYKKSGITVATKTIATVGSVITITVV